MNHNYLFLRTQTDGHSIATVVLLFAMLLLAAGLYWRRDHALKKTRRANRAFVRGVGPLLSEWRLHSVKDLAIRHRGSPLAQLMGEMSKNYLQALRVQGKYHPIEVVRRSAESGMRQACSDLRRGVGIFKAMMWGAPAFVFLSLVVQALSTGGIGVHSNDLLLAVLLGGIVGGFSWICYQSLLFRAAGAERALLLSVQELLEEMVQSCDEDSESLELAELVWG